MIVLPHLQNVTLASYYQWSSFEFQVLEWQLLCKWWCCSKRITQLSRHKYVIPCQKQMRDLFKNRNTEFFVGYSTSTISLVWPMIVLLGNLSLAQGHPCVLGGATPSVNSSYFDEKQSHPLCLSCQIMVSRWRAVLS